MFPNLCHPLLIRLHISRRRHAQSPSGDIDEVVPLRPPRTKPADAENPETPRLTAISCARCSITSIVRGTESAPSPAQMLYQRRNSRLTSENVERRSRRVDLGSSRDRFRRVSRLRQASLMSDSETNLGKSSASHLRLLRPTSHLIGQGEGLGKGEERPQGHEGDPEASPCDRHSAFI